jgi:predicted double-glycine peptidase
MKILAHGGHIWINGAMFLPAPVPAAVPQVPFYSQFKDIASPPWQKVGCGVTSLAMVIDYYTPDAVSVNALLKQGIAAGAYLADAGWSYKGLISLSNNYGLGGSSYDLGKSSSNTALAQLETYVKDGPVIASVHYKFDPKSTIPHLVVIDGIASSTVYYNDPAAKSGELHISVADFVKGWKKRFIVIRPASNYAAKSSRASTTTAA